MEQNLTLLPTTALKTADVVTELFTQVRDKVVSCTNYSIDMERYSISTSIDIDSMDAFVTFKDEITENGYFKLSDTYNISAVADTSKGATNPTQRIRADITLYVTEATVEAAKEAAGEGKKDEESSGSESSSEESKAS